MLAEGLPSPTSSSASKPSLAAVLLRKGSWILPLNVKGKRREVDGEESPLRGYRQDQVVLN